MSKWKWVLCNDDGSLVKGWSQVGDNWYLLDLNTGVMLTGWQKDSNGNWYYLDTTSGQMQIGWIQLNSKWYYLEEESNGNKGVAYMNGTFTINGKEYTFDDTCAMVDTDNIVSDDCVNFIKGFEGLSLEPYYDGTGTTDAQYTIGYGTTKASEPEAFENTPITEEQACYYLKKEITKMAKIIKADLDSKNISLSQSQQDALYSFSYNCGQDALLNSTLYKYICGGGRDADIIQSYFEMWDKAGGVVLAGLKARRIAESNIFNYDTYDSTH